MKEPPPNLLTVLQVAAELRAAGVTWEKIAAQVRRAVRTCRGWPREYPEVWLRLFREAEYRFFAEAAGEARTVLRNQMLSVKESTSQGAARELVRVRTKAWELESRCKAYPPDVVTQAVRLFAPFLENRNDADLKTLIAAVLHRLTGPAGGTAAGAPLPPDLPPGAGSDPPRPE